MNKSKTDIVVFETTDYSEFKKLLGNRDVTPSRLAAIKESILRIGYQPSPIIVNENNEVIDGQGRLAACESLGLPVYFVIKEGLTIDDCISMNIKMKNWADNDYINCYAQRLNDNYVRLKNMMDLFPLLSWNQLLVIGGLSYDPHAANRLRNGKLIFEGFSYLELERARWLSALVPYIKKSGLNNKSAVETLARLDRYKLIDRTRMLESFERYTDSVELNGARADATLASLNELYNFNRKKKVYFADDYRRIADKKKVNNLKSKEA